MHISLRHLAAKMPSQLYNNHLAKPSSTNTQIHRKQYRLAKEGTKISLINLVGNAGRPHTEIKGSFQQIT